MLDRIYDTPPEQYSNEEHSFLPLLYIVMSVGCLFSDDGAGTLDVSGYETAIGQGYVFFFFSRLFKVTCTNLPQVPILQGWKAALGDHGLSGPDLVASHLFHGPLPPILR